MTLLELKTITPQMLSAVLELDQLCFGGLWTLEGYQRELDSPNSVLLGLSPSPAPSTQNSKLSLEKFGGNQGNPDSKTTPTFRKTQNSLAGIGCLWAILEEAHITILAVHPCYRYQGLGQALLVALLEVAERRALERATLEVRASNQAAVSLYQKFGFKVAGRRQRYYPDDEDALILWRGGLQHPEFLQTLAHERNLVRDRLTAAGWNLQSCLHSPLLESLPSLTDN